MNRRWDISSAFSALFVAGIVCLVVLPATGCHGGPKLPPMAPVTCIVTLDGQPLPRGTVQLVPDDDRGTSGPPGVGIIDEKGRCTIGTAGADGAVVGYHKIAVEAREEFDEELISWAPSLIPEKYNNPDTSGLTAEVKQGEDNVIEIPLASAP